MNIDKIAGGMGIDPLKDQPGDEVKKQKGSPDIEKNDDFGLTFAQQLDSAKENIEIDKLTKNNINKLVEVRKKMESGFYNSEEVVKYIAEALLKSWTI